MPIEYGSTTELSIWIILTVVLAYYFIRFRIDVDTEWTVWLTVYGSYVPYQESSRPPADMAAWRLERRAYWCDIRLPQAFTSLALIAVGTTLFPYISLFAFQHFSP